MVRYGAEMVFDDTVRDGCPLPSIPGIIAYEPLPVLALETVLVLF